LEYTHTQSGERNIKKEKVKKVTWNYNTNAKKKIIYEKKERNDKKANYLSIIT